MNPYTHILLDYTEILNRHYEEHGEEGLIRFGKGTRTVLKRLKKEEARDLVKGLIHSLKRFADPHNEIQKGLYGITYASHPICVLNVLDKGGSWFYNPNVPGAIKGGNLNCDECRLIDTGAERLCMTCTSGNIKDAIWARHSAEECQQLIGKPFHARMAFYLRTRLAEVEQSWEEKHNDVSGTACVDT